MELFLTPPPTPGRRNITGILLVAIVVGLAALALVANAVVLTLAVSAATLPTSGSAGRVVPGESVAIYDLVGKVRVSGGEGRDVTVDVSRGGRDAEQLRIESGVIDGVSTLRVVYPADRIVYPELESGNRTQLEVREDGRFGDSSTHLGFGRRRVTLAGSGSGLEAHADLAIHVPDGKRLKVYLGAGHVDVSNVDGQLLVDVAAADVRTDRTRGTLSIDTGSGEVSVHDASGAVTIDTGSGAVDVRGLRGGALHVDTGSGGVTAADIESPSVSIDTGSGEVSLARVKADDIDVDTGSGEVDVDLLADIQRLHVDTGSGSVTIHAPSTLGAMVRLETSHHRIDSDFAFEILHRDEGMLEGRIGNGHGRIDVDTGSGGVRLTRSR